MKKEIVYEKALQALSECDTLTSAAEKMNVSRKTLYNFLQQNPEFLIEFRNFKRTQLRELADVLSDGAGKAAGVLTEIAIDPDADASARIKAAVSVLEYFTKIRSLEISMNSRIFVETDYCTEDLDIDFFSRKYPSAE